MRTTIAEPEPVTRRWTRSEYYAMSELGWFEGQRVELIEGEVIVSAAQSNPQNSSITKAERLLSNAFGNGYWIRVQMALFLNNRSEPEPDVSVVSGTEDDHGDEHPTFALLVVEVSGSSLKIDRARKAAIYAEAGIADYWIVNLWDRRLEVHRKPVMNEPGKYLYGCVETIDESGFVSPLAMPDAKIAVKDLLPLTK